MSEIRDPIHGFIRPTETEMRIIGSSLFQRLRRIRQLAMAFLAYPTANHTRFEHSLGVLHVATLMAEKMLPGPQYEDKRRTVRLAALLHDVGHGPFSHVSEEVLLHCGSSMDTPMERIHERITAGLIERNAELSVLLSEDERKRIVGLLSGERIDLSVMKDIVSGPLDADKIDYLLRDSYFCGVKYGLFDFDRMLNTLTTYADDSDRRLAVQHDGVHSLEQFVLAKYYMTTQVYRHKVRLVSDAMTVRGLQLGIERDGLEFLKKLYTYEDNDEYLASYLRFSDDYLVDQIVELPKDGFAKAVFRRLRERRLFRRLYSEKLTKIDLPDPATRDDLINLTSQKCDKARESFEADVAKVVGCEAEYVIVNVVQIKSIRGAQGDPESEIIVITEADEKARFDEESTVLRSIDNPMSDIFLEVYAPFEYGDDKERIRKSKSFRKEIAERIKSVEV